METSLMREMAFPLPLAFHAFLVKPPVTKSHPVHVLIFIFDLEFFTAYTRLQHIMPINLSIMLFGSAH